MAIAAKSKKGGNASGAMRAARKAVHLLVVLATILYLVTGLGITEFRTVEPLTGGLLTKTLSFQLHNALLYPFIVLLALHIFFALRAKRTGAPGER
jgi:cytochrome b subunit of formate dehydrogenase